MNNTLDTFLGNLKVTDLIKRAIGLQIGKRVIEEVDAETNWTTFGDQMRTSMVKALQATIDSRVEEKVIQGITATGFEGKIKTAVKEAAIAQRVDTEVDNAVSAHVTGTVNSAVAKAGIEDKVGAAVNVMSGCVERALQTKIDAHVESKVAQVIATPRVHRSWFAMPSQHSLTSHSPRPPPCPQCLPSPPHC